MVVSSMLLVNLGSATIRYKSGRNQNCWQKARIGDVENQIWSWFVTRNVIKMASYVHTNGLKLLRKRAAGDPNPTWEIIEPQSDFVKNLTVNHLEKVLRRNILPQNALAKVPVTNIVPAANCHRCFELTEGCAPRALAYAGARRI